MIKFLHMADLHIGSSAYISINVDELVLLHEIITEANKKDIDVIFISGDIYNSPPSKHMIERINTIFENFNGEIFLIYANHDFEAGTNSNDYNFPSNVHLYSTKMSSYYIEKLNLRVWGISYYDRFIKDDIYKEYFSNTKLNENEINILLAHGGDSDHIPMDYDFLSNTFDYVALGHFHTYQAKNNNVVYSGSLIATSKNQDIPHGYIIGEISKDSLNYNLVSTNKEFLVIDFDISNYTNIEKVYLDVLKAVEISDNKVILNIIGKKDLSLDFDIDHIKNIDNIDKVYDMSTYNIDYEDIYIKNKNNILGKFIETFQNKDDEISKMALEYGVLAFLEVNK